MAVPPPWLGLFQDSHIDHDAAQVFVQAGKTLTNGLEKTTLYVWKKTEVMTELLMYNDTKAHQVVLQDIVERWRRSWDQRLRR